VEFFPWHLAAAYGLDLILGDPPGFPHPIRWIGRLITLVEAYFYPSENAPNLQRAAGLSFWSVVVTTVGSATYLLIAVAFHINALVGQALVVWLAYTTLATRSLHRESVRVVKALRAGDLENARRYLARIVSRETGHLSEEEIVRALLETVAENISDGIVAPLFYLALGGPVLAMMYKAVNTMDSMVGYVNERHRHFGWFSARADDVANWMPARLSGMLLVAAAACCSLDWRGAWRIMRRDGRKTKSPNAGIPEAAAAGALAIRLGGPNVYFGQVVSKPYLGDAERPPMLEAYGSMIRLMYATSLAALILALGARFIFAYF
jgi:adenosylcobinamide-phosphate synthase